MFTLQIPNPSVEMTHTKAFLVRNEIADPMPLSDTSFSNDGLKIKCSLKENQKTQKIEIQYFERRGFSQCLSHLLIITYRFYHHMLRK